MADIQNSSMRMPDDDVFIPAHPRILYLRKLYALLIFQLFFACGFAYVMGGLGNG